MSKEKWLKHIEQDRDFDYGFLFSTIKFKLELMRDFFKSDKAFSAEADNVVIEINEVLALFDKIVADDYFEEALEFVADEGIEKPGYVFIVENELKKADLKKAFGLILRNVWKWWD